MLAEDFQQFNNTKLNIMKNFFLNIFYFFYNFKKRSKFKKFEKKLEGALADKAQNQIKLIKLIKKEIDILWPKGRSKFIPLSIPQRNEIRSKVYAKYGETMNKLKVHLDNNLQFK